QAALPVPARRRAHHTPGHQAMKRALVTGGTKGIGAAIVRALVRDGVRVATPARGPVSHVVARWTASPSAALRARLLQIDGAPARNQIAIAVSKRRQPNDDVGMNGQIGLP